MSGRSEASGGGPRAGALADPGRERGELRGEGLGVGPRQAADLDHGTGAAAVRPTHGRGAHPQAAAADEQREQQAGDHADGGPQDEDLAGVLGDLEGGPLVGAGVGHAAAARELPGLAGPQGLGRLVDLGQPVLVVERVDRRGRAGVQAEVAAVADQGQHGQVGRGVHARHLAALGVLHRGRGEDALEGELLRTGVGRLDRAGRQEVRVLRQARDRLVERDLAVGVLDDDARRVAVADQVDLRAAPGVEGVVDAQPVRALRRVGAGRPRQPGLERAGDAGLGVGGVELVEGEVERREAGLGEALAGRDVVVVGAGVGEALALLDQHRALEAEQAAEGDADEQHDERDVEQQVAGLAQVALLGAELVPPDRAPPARQRALVPPPRPRPAPGRSPSARTPTAGPGSPGPAAAAPAAPARAAGCGGRCSRRGRRTAAGRPRRTTGWRRRRTATAGRARARGRGAARRTRSRRPG